MTDRKSPEEQHLEFLREIIRGGGAPLPHDLRPQRALRSEEAAAYLGLSVAALRWHRRHGSGPSFAKLGAPNGVVVYPIPFLDAWLKARRVPPTKPARHRGRPAKER